MSAITRAASAPPSPAKGVFFAMLIAAPMWLVFGVIWVLAGLHVAGIALGTLGLLCVSSFVFKDVRR